MSELLPCLGCGGKAFGPYGPHPDGHQQNMRSFECDTIECPIYFFDSTDDEDAIRQWNTRTPATSPTETDFEQAIAEWKKLNGWYMGDRLKGIIEVEQAAKAIAGQRGEGI